MVHHWLAGTLGIFLVVVVVVAATALLPFGAVAYRSLRRVGRWRSLVACMVLLPAVWLVAEVVRSGPQLAGSWACPDTPTLVVTAIAAKRRQSPTLYCTSITTKGYRHDCRHPIVPAGRQRAVEHPP